MVTVVADNPLKRINLKEKPEILIKKILLRYDLGTLKSYKVLTKGIVEINFRIMTTSGEYVLKIFSNKRLWRVSTMAFAQEKFIRKGIPFPKIYKNNKHRNYFIVYSKTNHPYYGWIIDWFNGQDFNKRSASPRDLKKIAYFLAKIHKIKMNIKPIYDDCFPYNLKNEYRKKKNSVEKEIKPLVSEIVREFNRINLKKLKKSTIHGDLQWDHVLKNKKNQFCLLDLGALNILPQVLDLAYTISFFSVNPNNPLKSNVRKNYQIILKEYLKYNKLPDYDLKNLPLFVRASWVSDYVMGRQYKDIFGKRIWFGPKRLKFLLKVFKK